MTEKQKMIILEKLAWFAGAVAILLAAYGMYMTLR